MLIQGSEWIEDEFAFRVMAFVRKGDACIGHDHNFPHPSFVNKGAVLLETLEPAEDGDIRCVSLKFNFDTGLPVEKTVMCKVVSAQVIRSTDVHNWRTIPAGVFHRITAEEDNTQCICLFAHRNTRGHIVEKYQGNKQATL